MRKHIRLQAFLLVLPVAMLAGCSHMFVQGPHCGSSVYNGPFARVQAVASSCDPCEDCDGCHDLCLLGSCPLGECLAEAHCRLATCKYRCQEKCKIAVGPPAIPYKPAMPPEFLPVPVGPVFSPVNPQTPVPARGAVERNFGPQLTISSRD